MKIKFCAFALLCIAFSAPVYGEIVLIRPGGSVGYFSADDIQGFSYSYGGKILLAANDFQRYGILIDNLCVEGGKKLSYLRTGIFLEQIVFKYFNMGIGTIGYIDLSMNGENPFGLYTHLGFEYSFTKHISLVAAYQSDFIFRKSFTSNNAFLLEIGFRF